MKWRDVVALVRRSIRRRPGRAALTAVAVALATALLTALVTIASTAEQRVLDGLAKGGPLTGIRVAAAEPDPGQAGRDNPKAGERRELDAIAIRRITGLPHVERVMEVTAANVLITDPGEPDLEKRSRSERLIGVDLRRTDRLPVTLVAGRLPLSGAQLEVAVTEGFLARRGTPKEKAAAFLRRELVVTNLGTGSGAKLRRLTIVGVVNQDVAPGELLVDRNVVAAESDWSRTSGFSDSRFRETLPNPVVGLFVTADSLERVPAVRAAIARAGYSSSAPENLVAAVRRYLRVVEIVLSGIGFIALVIAALGVTNALLAAVRERRREIGVLKAIGSRDKDVRRLFLTEAASLGALGGVLGAAVGYGLARTVGFVVNGYLTRQGVEGVQLGLPWGLLVSAAFGATALAALAGVLPANRAARLPAREAVDL